MSEKEEKGKKQLGIALDLPTGIMAGVALGILLVVIGAGATSEGAYYAGVAIVTLALFGGAFLLKEEDKLVRLGMFIAAGLALSFLPQLGAAISYL